LFRLPTRLYAVAVVVDKNQSDAKLIPNATWQGSSGQPPSPQALQLSMCTAPWQV
jgi:hypothetical protein